MIWLKLQQKKKGMKHLEYKVYQDNMSQNLECSFEINMERKKLCIFNTIKDNSLIPILDTIMYVCPPSVLSAEGTHSEF